MRWRGARGNLDLSVTNERTIVEFGHCLAQLFLRVHDDGPVPHDRLLERFARDEQKADAFRASLDDDLIATVEEDERMVLRVVNGLSIRVDR